MPKCIGVLLDRPVRLVREGPVGENKQDLPCGWTFEFGTQTPLRRFLAIVPDAPGPDQIAPCQAARRPARLTLEHKTEPKRSVELTAEGQASL
jgi:hypothetical protein